jgi:allophanate hydrolase subunit 2
MDEPIALVLGPDADEAIVHELARTELRISPTSDRTGTRLDGPLSPAPAQAMTRRSTPMTIGAIERTPSGLIVLGPDHPTTGGYPVVALVRAASLDAFMAKPIGATVRFRFG